MRLNSFPKTGCRPVCFRIYFPKGHMGKRQGLQPRQRPPSPIAEISARVISTPAAMRGRIRSKMVAPAYMTQPGRPRTGTPPA